MTPQYRALSKPSTQAAAAEELHRAIRSARAVSRHLRACYLHTHNRSPDSVRLLRFAEYLDAVVVPLGRIERGMR